MVKPTNTQIAQIQEAVYQAGNAAKFANSHRINRGHVSMALNGIYLTPKMCKAMGWDNYIEVPQSTIDTMNEEIDDLMVDIEMLRDRMEYYLENQIPAGQVPVTPCPDCGKPHRVPWCVERDGEPQRPKPPSIYRKRVYPSYAKMRTDDIEQVQKQLARYYPGQFDRKE